MVPLQARALVAPVATVVAVVAVVAGESMGHRERSRERVDFGIW